MSSDERVRGVLQGLRQRAESCREKLATVPTDADEMNVRSHVRLRAKASTYDHAADLLQAALEKS